MLIGLDPGFEHLRRLTEISRALTYTTSLDQVARLTVERAAELLDASAGVLLLPDADGMLIVRAAHGISTDHLDEFRLHVADELIARLNEMLGVAEDCFIAVPLIVGGEVTGVLAVATGRTATSADEWLLSALADHAAVAIENARQTGEVRTEMEERLRASEGETSAKDRALSTLAHDIRTPLGAIDGYSAILQEEIQGPINDRQRETLGRIRMSGQHLLSLLENVMDMARISAGVVRVDMEPVSLNDVAREAAQMLVHAADAKLQKLEVSELSDVVVIADHERLRQVLVNLIGNAVKFTSADGCISVKTADCVAADKTYGEIRVIDTGPGIAREEQRAVFEPYYRSDAAGHAPGVGLGLAISHALIKQMGGELLLDSEEGVGSTFTVRFPAANQQEH